MNAGELTSGRQLQDEHRPVVERRECDRYHTATLSEWQELGGPATQIRRGYPDPDDTPRTLQLER